MYSISICLLIKDENKYLYEWIEWHNALGIEHYYIYDNGSYIPVKDTLLELYPEHLFTFVDWSGDHNHIQIDAYNHCLEHYGSESKWITFIDTDEFIHCNSGYLDMSKYDSYPYVRVNWKVFDANGQISYSSKDVQKRFTHETDYDIGIRYKAIVQPSLVEGMMVHDAVTAIPPATTDDMIIHHYYTRSLEEWQEKIMRGTCSPECKRRYDEFFKINPDLIQHRDDSFMLNRQNYQQNNYKYDIRIMAHPSRKEMVKNILGQLGMSEDIVIYDDRKFGGDAIYTAEKAWKSPFTENDITHRIILQDDIILADNFLEKCKDIVNTVPDNPISLSNTFIAGLPEYKYKSCCYFITHEIWGVGIIMPIKYIEPCWNWINSQKGTDNYCKCDDIMIMRYFESQNINAYTTIPCLVQHISDAKHESLITAFGDLNYLGDRISTTFEKCPNDDFTIFVPPRDSHIALKMSFIRARARKIMNNKRR